MHGGFRESWDMERRVSLEGGQRGRWCGQGVTRTCTRPQLWATFWAAALQLGYDPDATVK